MEAIESILSDVLVEWERLQGDAPAVLYHYTDVAGLIGICSSQSVWASNLRFMNDARELAHARKLIVDVLDEAKEQATEAASLS